MEAAVIQILTPALVIVLGAGVALLRAEVRRYAAAHPTSTVVRDVETVLKDARALAPTLGLTGPRAAAFLSGALTAAGLPVTAQTILDSAKAVEADATADAAVLPVTPAAPPVPAPAVLAAKVQAATVAAVAAAQAPVDPAPTPAAPSA